MKPRSTVVVDNGAATIKAGVLGVHTDPRVVTNAIVRSKGDKMTYIGHEFEKCRDHSSLHYRLPFEKGFLLDWDAEKAVWDGLFSAECLGINTTESSLLITEPYFNLPNIQNVYDQFVFEEYEFHSYYRCTPASLIPHGDLFAREGYGPPDCMLLVDSGFSFTHVVPIMNDSILWNAVARIDVGGKLLTNHLKELASFRQWNMMDETYIINDIKETCCYISTNYKEDLEVCRQNPRSNAIVQEYVLPDFSMNRIGHVRQPGEALEDTAQVMYMNNERFSVPETIFRPDDIGLEQSGIAPAVANSIALLPEDFQGMFWAHIGLVGGNTRVPGFRERLLSELRALAPVDCEVIIYASNDPILETYRSATAFAQKPEFLQGCVTREEYLEFGSNACRRKFRDSKRADKEATRGREQAKGRAATRAREDEDESEGESPPVARKGGRGRGRGRGTMPRRQV